MAFFLFKNKSYRSVSFFIYILRHAHFYLKNKYLHKKLTDKIVQLCLIIFKYEFTVTFV